MLAQHFRVEFNRGILLKNVTEIQEKLGRNLPNPEEKKGARFVLTPLMAVIELRSHSFNGGYRASMCLIINCND